jgi:tetratricopeptide (TPR) repeat protein
MNLQKIPAILILLLLALVPPVSLAVGSGESEDLGLWEDPEFQKRFLGSYGFRSEIEPVVTSVEREQMEKILPLLSSDPEEAARQLEKITQPGSSAVFDFTLGNVYFQQGELDKAAACYEAALEKFPSYLRAHKNLGLIQVRTGRFEDAIDSLSRVIELGGADGLTAGLLGYAYAAVEEFVSAESAYRNAVLLDPDTRDWKMGLTQAVLRQKKYAEAVSLCRELIADDPDRAELWLLQANAYVGLEQNLEAAQNFEVVQRMGKATPRSLQTLGDIYVNESLWDLAARAYRQALEIEDAEADIPRHLRNVEVLAQRGALEQARTVLAALEESHGDALDEADRRKTLKLGARLAVAEGDGSDAAEILEQIVELDPLDGEALILLGRHYSSAQDYERAAFYYERAEQLEDFEADAKLRHAQLLVEQSRYDEALPLLRRAQEMEPREDVARYIDQVARFARTRR